MQKSEYRNYQMGTIESIWKSLHSRLKSFILSKVKDSSLADDILHDVFVKAHSHIDKLRESDKIVPWLFQIARNQILDHFRSKKKIHSAELIDSVTDEDFTGLTTAMHTAVKDMIGMMDDLSPEYCEALCAVELEGMSQISFAEKNGIPYSTVKSRVQRARLQLRDMMMKCCHYQFDKYGTILSIRPIHCCCCTVK